MLASLTTLHIGQPCHMDAPPGPQRSLGWGDPL